MPAVYLLLGTNLGDRERLLERACAMLEEWIVPEGETLRRSSVYQTEPWGFESPDLFLNQAVSCRTRLAPQALMQACLEIEDALGRVRTEPQTGPGGERKYASRMMDIDILLYGTLTLDLPAAEGLPAVQVPHPRLTERLFALEPLAELAPDLEHPAWGKPVKALRDELKKKQ